MIRTTVRAAAIAFSLGALSCIPSCQSVQNMPQYADAAKNILGKWDLQELMGQAVSLAGPSGEKPGFEITDDGRLAGFSGVNRFTSTLDMQKLLGGEFSLSPAAATKMAGPPEAMNLESRFFDALNRVTGFDLKGNSLTLKSGAETLAKLIRG